MPRLADKVAIVTGAGTGIGRATSLLFANEGAHVMAAVYEAAQIAPLEKNADAFVGSIVGLQTDVTNEGQVERLVRETLARFRRIDILVNNAGVDAFATVTETTNELWDHILGVNLKGAFFCCRAVVPHMLQQGRGVIVNNASVNGLRGNLRYAAYCSSKSGLIGLTRAMALDYAPHNIRVNCVCPGTILDTGMAGGTIQAAKHPEELTQRLIEKHPLGRLGKADEVAQAILFLASDEASFITGVELPVDGGRHIR